MITAAALALSAGLAPAAKAQCDPLARDCGDTPPIVAIAADTVWTNGPIR